MTGSARKHHYVPQCYLRGFIASNEKISQLEVIDLQQRRHFKSNIKNLACKRDFNKIVAEDVDPNILESNLSSFESDLATILKKVATASPINETEIKIVLTFIAILSVRTPFHRNHFEQVQESMLKMAVSSMLANEERWERQQSKMKESGVDLPEISYEQIKSFHDNDEYTISVGTNRSIGLELHGVQTVFPCLSARSWRLYHTDTNVPFITSDMPVTLMWKDPEKVPRFFRNSPGFGMNDTQVVFPLSKNVAMVGEFDMAGGEFYATPRQVAAINAITVAKCGKRVYAPCTDFPYMKSGGHLTDGRVLLLQK